MRILRATPRVPRDHKNRCRFIRNYRDKRVKLEDSQRAERCLRRLLPAGFSGLRCGIDGEGGIRLPRPARGEQVGRILSAWHRKRALAVCPFRAANGSRFQPGPSSVHLARRPLAPAGASQSRAAPDRGLRCRFSKPCQRPSAFSSSMMHSVRTLRAKSISSFWMVRGGANSRASPMVLVMTPFCLARTSRFIRLGVG